MKKQPNDGLPRHLKVGGRLERDPNIDRYMLDYDLTSPTFIALMFLRYDFGRRYISWKRFFSALAYSLFAIGVLFLMVRFGGGTFIEALLPMIERNMIAFAVIFGGFLLLFAFHSWYALMKESHGVIKHSYHYGQSWFQGMGRFFARMVTNAVSLPARLFRLFTPKRFRGDSIITRPIVHDWYVTQRFLEPMFLVLAAVFCVLFGLWIVSLWLLTVAWARFTSAGEAWVFMKTEMLDLQDTAIDSRQLMEELGGQKVKHRPRTDQALLYNDLDDLEQRLQKEEQQAKQQEALRRPKKANPEQSAPPPASNDELDVNKAFDELQDEFGDWGED